MKSWDGWCWGGAYGCLCDRNRWGESGRVGCIRSRVYGAVGEGEGVSGDWTDVGDLGGDWAWESEGGGFSVGFGPGLDSMSPARSKRSSSHTAGSHGWLP